LATLEKFEALSPKLSTNDTLPSFFLNLHSGKVKQ